MPNFGYETIGSKTTQRSQGIVACRFNLPEPAKALSITMYFIKRVGYAPYMRCGLYRREGDSLYFIAETEREDLIKVSDVWLTLNFPAPQPILVPSDYWLAVFTDDAYFLSYDNGEPDQFVAVQAVFWIPNGPNGTAPFPPTVFLPGNVSPYKVSIYCTYELVTLPIVTVKSTPIVGIPITVNGSPIGKTPTTTYVTEGNHTIETPTEVEI